ncbi:hypothetical protein A3Q56_03580 [Intoshia linei]|uniref:C2H2-type domain-containing protein n=1 Tax=Intoshia linei TaxID=1819745 RepID=A0A177B4X5_9BILA|nr:hypothetical protein A3Q56_03580 [Intoshia linei]
MNTRALDDLRCAILNIFKDYLPQSKKIELIGVISFVVDRNTELFVKFNDTLDKQDTKHYISQYTGHMNGVKDKSNNRRKGSLPVKFLNSFYIPTNVIKDNELTKNQFTPKYSHFEIIKTPSSNGRIYPKMEPKALQNFNAVTHSPRYKQIYTKTKAKRRRMTDDQLNQEDIGEYLGEGSGISSKICCTTCKVVIDDVSSYFKHSVENHESYICHSCSKSFTTKSSLLRHRPIHTGLRRFACKFCEKSFYRRDKCKTHIKRHLSPSMHNSVHVDEFNSVGIPTVIKSTNENGNNFYDIQFKHKELTCPCTINTNTSVQNSSFCSTYSQENSQPIKNKFPEIFINTPVQIPAIVQPPFPDKEEISGGRDITVQEPICEQLGEISHLTKNLLNFTKNEANFKSKKDILPLDPLYANNDLPNALDV